MKRHLSAFFIQSIEERQSMHQRWPLVMLVTLVAGVMTHAATSFGATRNWNVGSGNWSVAGNWSPAGVPLNGDDLNLVSTEGSPDTITYDYTGPPVALGHLVLQNSFASGGDPATITLLIAANNLSSVGELVGGATGGLGRGAVIQSGGTNTIGMEGLAFGGSLTPGDFGTYTISGGSLTSSGPELIGNLGGNGVFNQTGGANVITSGSSLILAQYPRTSGTYNLSSGLVSAPSVFLADFVNPDTSLAGTAVFNINGTGTLNVSNTLTIISNAAGNSGVYLSAGTINAGALNFNGVPSHFHWTGGTLNLMNNVTWDSAAAPTSTSSAFGPALTLDSGQTLMITGDEAIGGTGLFALTLNTGSSHYVTGTLTLNPTGTLTQSPGSSIYAAGITQAGGTINGSFVNQTAFTYQSGQFNGRLINQGSVALGPTFLAGNGIENDASMTVSTGQTLNTSTGGLDNFGTFALAGGTLSGSAAANNDYGGEMHAHGTINSVVFNYGRLTVDGTLRLNGGANNYGALQGAGTVFGTVTNQPVGSIFVAAGNQLSFVSALANSGLVTLDGPGAIISGGGISNNGTIQGAGTVVCSVANAGTIRASGGELDLSGPAGGQDNSATGQIQAATGNTVMYVSGLSNNSGTIALSGGTFDNNNFPITNATKPIAGSGYIIGSGIFRSGGLINNGTVRFADNPTSVYGSVTTAGPGSIVNLINNTTTFYGPVTVAADSTLITNNATARFLAGLSGNVTTGLANSGAASFSGADAVYGSVVNTGSMTVGASSSAAFNGQFSGTGSIGNSGTLVFNTSASAPDAIVGPLTNNPSASMVVNGDGTVEVDAAPTLGNSSSIYVNNTSRLKFNFTNGLATIGTGVTATVNSGAMLELAGTRSALSGGGRVNILNNSTAPTGILVSGTYQQVGNLDGSGMTQVNAGSDLTANHFIQSALVIGGTATSHGLVTIDASDASGSPLGNSSGLEVASSVATGAQLSNAIPTSGGLLGSESSQGLGLDSSTTSGGSSSVPEPSALVLVATGGMLLAIARRLSKRRVALRF